MHMRPAAGILTLKPVAADVRRLHLKILNPGQSLLTSVPTVQGVNARMIRGILCWALFTFACAGFPAAAQITSVTNAPGAAAALPAAGVENAVVKIFSTMRYPDPYRPWTKQSPTDATGTGVVIKGKRILTNAHMVNYASQIQIQANQAGDKVSATLEFIAPGIDLAVLKLDDESFFEAHPALAMSTNLPEIKDPVMAYGYPEGGNNLSITKGIVSRIEFAGYNYSVSGMRIQIDAAINPGNSGGPAVVGDKMIGLAFSHLGQSENIGYIIPVEEIELFLQDIADGHYDGKPALYDDLQTLENPALRQFLKLDKSVNGMIVHKPVNSDAAYPLKEWDVITRIGDVPVDDQGMIKLRENLRVNFTYEVQKVAKAGGVPLTIVRAGKAMEVQVPVFTKRPQVIPDLETLYPSYFICGPVVFSDATKQFLGSFLGGQNTERWVRALTYAGNPMLKRLYEPPAFEGERLVVVSSPFFPHALVKDYSPAQTQVVKSINGVAIKNLKHLVQVLRDSKDEFLVLAFDSTASETCVFPRKEFLAATEDILTDNGIRSQGSPDTMAIWNAKP
jgi:S1-C subfamily serine protease